MFNTSGNIDLQSIINLTMLMATQSSFKLNPGLIIRASSVLRAIKHPLRQEFLRIMHKRKSLTVTELFQQLNLEQAVASQHLAILRKAGLVITQRRGKFICYSVNYERLEQIDHLAAELIND